MEKRPIIETLRGMEVGAVELFPLTQYNSVRNSQYTNLMEERARGMVWDVKADIIRKACVVTRVA